jgi:hypothetical protein
MTTPTDDNPSGDSLSRFMERFADLDEFSINYVLAWINAMNEDPDVGELKSLTLLCDTRPVAAWLVRHDWLTADGELGHRSIAVRAREDQVRAEVERLLDLRTTFDDYASFDN